MSTPDKSTPAIPSPSNDPKMAGGKPEEHQKAPTQSAVAQSHPLFTEATERFAAESRQSAVNQAAGETARADYSVPTPRTANFMLRIDDSEIDLDAVETHSHDMECELIAMSSQLAKLSAERDEAKESNVALSRTFLARCEEIDRGRSAEIATLQQKVEEITADRNQFEETLKTYGIPPNCLSECLSERRVASDRCERDLTAALAMVETMRGDKIDDSTAHSLESSHQSTGEDFCPHCRKVESDARKMGTELCGAYQEIAALTEQNATMRGALTGLVEVVTDEANEHDSISGRMGARLSDARSALAQRNVDEAAGRGVKVTHGRDGQ